ncbi:helix-turn-helix transcriptional regulator [Amycolatopsis pithecellobii]|uniref:Helix-turn-helix domain-containing protein n=1 Tax=Amycolatopsis pithecellobii TaxID=664692 RepID=A0A6N7ZBX7_9PSEU|nr:helix-turn-helix transcriptional regulator [Amycolatopsis pithecellobii]MTD59205.1 helix-turn-helix domain-containing protein [Amycolatopsis pithecellobii]
MSIAEYLRGVRARLEPVALGLPYSGTRRVPGLRREEVAVLAGVSVDYYTRIEQGRETNPSAQIIEALARGLDLTGDEREHLFRLAGYQAPVSRRLDQVRPELARLLGQWRDQAAFVLTGTLDVMAPNSLARALFSGFTEQDNLARMVFLDPVGRTFYTDWDRAAESVVSVLRHNSTRLPAPCFDPFIREMSEASERFERLWKNQHVRGKTHAVKRLHHPEAGDLSLEYHALEVPGSDAWQVVIYVAEPGTTSAEAFALLHACAPAPRLS